MKRVHLFYPIAAAVGLSLSACGIADDGGMRSPVPVTAGGGGAAAGSSAVRSGGDLSSQPLYSQQPSDDYNIPGVREVHAVSDISQCQQMSQNFKAQGIRLRLTRAKPTGDPNLRYLCIFEGPDAIANRFAEDRYNNPQENQ